MNRKSTNELLGKLDGHELKILLQDLRSTHEGSCVFDKIDDEGALVVIETIRRRQR
jgi:hypothetical protein